MKRNSLIYNCCTACLLGIALARSALGAQTTWSTTSSGSWNESGNWNGPVPTIALAVAITNGGSKVVTLDSTTPILNRAARRLDIHAPAATTNELFLHNLGNDPLLLANSLSLDEGGRLTISNALLVLDGAQGGSINQFAGELLLAGGGIVTTNSDPQAGNGQPGIRIGRSGLGQALIVAGEVQASDELIVGDLTGGVGNLILSNGLAHARGVLSVANNAGARGEIKIFDGSLVATNVPARIGDDGDGTLSQYGGLVSLDSSSVGRGSNSIGHLNLFGGLMRAGSLSLGRFATAQGILLVSGGELNLGTNSLYIGREGSGQAFLSNGVVKAGALILAASNTALANLQIHGGTLIISELDIQRAAGDARFGSGILVVGRNSIVANGKPFVVGDGVHLATLQLDDGIHNFADGIVVSANATLRGTGTVLGAVTVLPGGQSEFALPAPAGLAANLVNGQLHVSFPTTVGKLYDIFTNAEVSEAVWDLDTTFVGTGFLVTYTNQTVAKSRFFRIRVR